MRCARLSRDEPSPAVAGQNAGLQVRRCLDWGEPRTVRPAKSSASSVTPGAFTAGRDKEARYVVALSRVPRGERGWPVSPATGLPRQLSGLLSGILSTGTRPQARAKLGNRQICSFASGCKKKSHSCAKKFAPGVVGGKLNRSLRKNFGASAAQCSTTRSMLVAFRQKATMTAAARQTNIASMT
jgi:hypothetical protein